MAQRTTAVESKEVQKTIDEINNKSVLSLTFKKVFSDFQEFAYKNNVVVAATGWSIGVATKEVIDSFLFKVILPIFSLLSNLPALLVLRTWFLRLPMASKLMEIVSSLFGSILTWVLTLISTFLILEYVLNRQIVGLKTTISDNEKAAFITSKAQSKDKQIVPVTSEEIRDFKKELIIEKAEEALIKAKSDQSKLTATADIQNIDTFVPFAPINHGFDTFMKQ
jgi:large-conductance mechanosensitive channel